MRSKSVLTILLVGFSLAALTTGCKKRVAVSPPAVPPVQEEAAPPALKAPTATLVAEPGTIQRGQSATLKWSTSDTTEVTISGLGDVPAEGKRDINPAESTTFRLTAKGPGGSVFATAAVTVIVPPPMVSEEPAQVKAKSLADRIETELVDAYFDFDKSHIREDARGALAKDSEALRSILADFPDGDILLEGHCDDRGSAEYNLALGDKRATSASAYPEELGVNTSRLKRTSYGKEKPQCIESTEECWQKNRRVHFAPTAN
jgi:peptidoglycan-associated lipoprotein